MTSQKIFFSEIKRISKRKEKREKWKKISKTSKNKEISLKQTHNKRKKERQTD